jgi:hypothetical protein
MAMAKYQQQEQLGKHFCEGTRSVNAFYRVKRPDCNNNGTR